jgi:hypothetical protein
MIKWRYGTKKARPCPFCGCTKIVIGYADAGNHEGQICFLACHLCEAKTRAVYDSWDYVIEPGLPSEENFYILLNLWNNRAGGDGDGLHQDDQRDG